MGKHDLKAKQIQVEEIINAIIANPVLISSILRYRNANSFVNDRDIPDIQTVKSLIVATNVGFPDWQTGVPTDEKGFVLHTVDGVKYIFQSLVDDNVSEPSLSSGTLPAWTDLGSNGIFLNWNLFDPFPVDTLVRMNDVIYKSKSSDPGHNPELDTSHTYWDYIGFYAGFFTPGDTYDLNNVVNDTSDSFRRYKSNANNNNAPLNGTISSSKWQLIGARQSEIATTTLTYNEADINSDGYLVIRSGDTTSISGKNLLSAYVGDQPVTEAFYYPTDQSISGFGNWIGQTGLTIKITFI